MAWWVWGIIAWGAGTIAAMALMANEVGAGGIWLFIYSFLGWPMLLLGLLMQQWDKWRGKRRK